MGWMKVDDGLHSHPKRWIAGVPAMGLWIVCGSWVASAMTDGFIPATVAESQGGKDWKKLAAKLVEAGLWTPGTSHRFGDGYRMHDWTDFNIARVDWETRKAETAERVARHRARKAAAREAA